MAAPAVTFFQLPLELRSMIYDLTVMPEFLVDIYSQRTAGGRLDYSLNPNSNRTDHLLNFARLCRSSRQTQADVEAYFYNKVIFRFYALEGVTTPSIRSLNDAALAKIEQIYLRFVITVRARSEITHHIRRVNERASLSIDLSYNGESVTMIEKPSDRYPKPVKPHYRDHAKLLDKAEMQIAREARRALVAGGFGRAAKDGLMALLRAINGGEWS